MDYINTVRSTTAWLKGYVAICFRSLNEKETYINNGLYNIKLKTSTKSDSNVRIEETKHFSDEEKKKDQELRKNYPLGDFQSSEDSLLLLSDEKEIDTETNDLEEEQEGEEDDNGELTLAKCLRKFTKKERLDDQNMWYCNKCKEHVNADKKVDIWTTPDILIIHFKRFYAINQYTQGKIDDLVTFPIEGLDFSSIMKGPQFAEAPPIYDLYAVSQQSGSLSGGHYTAVCQNFMNKKWYSFNDDFVRVCDASDAIDDRAYVLMYHRRTGSLRGGGLTSPKILGLPPTLNDEPPENHEDEDDGNNFDGKYDDDDAKDNFAADTNEFEEGYTMFN